MKVHIITALLLTGLMSGCQISQSAKTNHDVSVKSSENQQKILTNVNENLLTDDPWSFVQSGLQINIPDNARIRMEKDKILKNKTLFEANILRSEPYIYYIINQLNERNMPVELALVPLIESAYNPLATSYAKAAGLWQIVPITAKEYGLTQNSWYDSRRDVIESTSAAINLLQYLNQRFDGDWLLTLAAYNAGEGRVRRAIESNKVKGLPTNFWALNLSKETMQYVPRLLAITDIIKHSNKYNISLPSCTYTNSLVRIDLAEQISLDKIAQYSGISLDELLEYNAGYLKKVVKGPYHLFVPASYAQTLHDKLAKLNLANSQVVDLLSIEPAEINPKYTYFAPSFTNNKYLKITDHDITNYENEHKRYSQITYRVKSGDNLSSIAKNYHVKVSELVKWNKINNSNKLKPGDKLAINIKN